MVPFLRALILFGICIIYLNPVQSQHCGSLPTPEQIEYLTQTREARQNFDYRQMLQDRTTGTPLHWVPVRFQECLSSSTQYPTVYYDEISEWMTELNAFFLPYDIQFFECSPIDTFIDPVLYHFHENEEPLVTPYEVPNVINVFLFASITTNNFGQVGGYAYLPPSPDRFFMSKAGGSASADVFIHEMGHYLGLYHTHGKVNAYGTDELVNGSNCTTAGDDVCDTAADPNLFYFSQTNCVYYGMGNDINGDPYMPDGHNFMSYAARACYNTFSVGQMNRMVYSILNDRSNLTGCNHPEGCDNPVTTLPVVYDFENDLEGWHNRFYPGFEMIEFVHNTGPTPTPNTGPSQAYSGSGYVYLNAANVPYYGSFGTLVSPCFDLRNTISPHLSLKYHAYGADIEYVAAQYSMDGGNTFMGDIYTAPLILEGNQGDAWVSVDLDLTAFKNTAAFQIRLYGGTYGTLGDVAFDSIAIYDTSTPPCGLTLNSVVSQISCFGANNGSITALPSGVTTPVTFLWSTGATTNHIAGLSPGAYTVTISAGSGCSLSADYTIFSPNILAASTTQVNNQYYGQNNGSATVQPSGGTSPYIFSWSNGGTTPTISNLPAGTYTVTVTDSHDCFVTRTVVITAPANGVTCTSYYSNFPYFNNFENNTLGIFQQVAAPVDHFNWVRTSGATNPATTGPNAAYEGSWYYTARANGNNAPNKTAMIKTTHCLNLNPLSNPVLEFYYHMYGSQMGSLAVQASMDNEQTWVTVWSIAGNQGTNWVKATVNLLPYRTGYTKLRIVCTTGTGSLSDMAIDALYIGEGTSSQLPAAEVLPEIAVSPNPSQGIFTVETGPENSLSRVEVFDAAGKVIWTKSNPGDWFQIDLSGAMNGVYFMRTFSGESSDIKRLLLLK